MAERTRTGLFSSRLDSGLIRRLKQQRRRGGKSGSRLSEIYTWFTEGFDTPDPREAKTSLEAPAG